MGVEGQLRLADVLRLPDAVVLSEKQEDQQALTELMCGALDQAVNQLKQARAQEGMRLKADIESRLAYILEKRAAIAQRAPLVVADYRDIAAGPHCTALGDQAQLDEARLMQECGVFADKASIAES
jgi:uncharacterized protein (TIGR00255 family)